MNNEKFIIINLIKELIDSFDKYLTNFPKSEIELKHFIYETCYEMLKLTYEANQINLNSYLCSYINLKRKKD